MNKQQRAIVILYHGEEVTTNVLSQVISTLHLNNVIEDAGVVSTISLDEEDIAKTMVAKIIKSDKQDKDLDPLVEPIKQSLIYISHLLGKHLRGETMNYGNFAVAVYRELKNGNSELTNAINIIATNHPAKVKMIADQDETTVCMTRDVINVLRNIRRDIFKC